MLLDDPQLRGGPSAVQQPETSALGAFGAAMGEGFRNTSLAMGADKLNDIGYKDDQVLSADDYNLSPWQRDGGYTKGMTVAQAKVVSAKIDSDKAAKAEYGHGVATFTGHLAGGALDPLFYIPYLDTFSPEVKAAMIARRGAVAGNAGVQAVNAMAAAALEQPLAFSHAKEYGQDYDATDAATAVLEAGLAGGTFGAIHTKLNLMFPQKVAGMAQALDDINMGRQVSTGDIVQPKPDYTAQVQASLRAGVTPTDIDPAEMDPRSQRAVAVAKTIDDGLKDKKPAGWRPVTDDDVAFLDSYRADGGASYFRDKIAELDRRTEEGAEARKRYDDMSDAERRQSHFTDELTGIPNARAYSENERMPVQVRTDMDNFKEVNDRLGHDVGDVAIKKAATIMDEEFRKVGGRAYRASHAGDEFPAEAPSQAAADAAIKSARERMERLNIEATGPDGTIYRKKGLGISYGSGDTAPAAEKSLLSDKDARTKAGLRRSGGQSDLERVAAVPAGGDQDHLGDRAARLAYYRDQLAAAEHPGVRWDATGPAAPPTPKAKPGAEPEEPDLTGLPLTESDKTHLAKVDEEAAKLEGMARALKAGAACFGLE